jgi:hypothetical protein
MDTKVNKLSSEWNMWFHKINDKDWKIESYKNIANINSLESFMYYYSSINTFVYGMFFLMKNNIPPLWEDKNNVRGGIITYKIIKSQSDSIWKNLTMALIGNTLTPDYKYINGISISPKINNCIIKIWVNNSKMLTKIKFNENVDLIKNSTPIFKTFNNTSY